jgi:hypothetical protein
MTRQSFEQLAPQDPNYAVNHERMLWVVTVHAPMATDGSPGMMPQVKSVYSVAYDAATGQWTDMCIGCAWLSQGR